MRHCQNSLCTALLSTFIVYCAVFNSHCVLRCCHHSLCTALLSTFIVFCTVVNSHCVLRYCQQPFIPLTHQRSDSTLSQRRRHPTDFLLRSQHFFPLHWRRNFLSLCLWHPVSYIKALLILIAFTKQIFDFFLTLILNFARIKEFFEFTKRSFGSFSRLKIIMLKMSLTCTQFLPIRTSLRGVWDIWRGFL